MHVTLFNAFCAIVFLNAGVAQVRGTTIGQAKKVRDVFSACLRIDVPADTTSSSRSDGHSKLVMCFVEVGHAVLSLRSFRLTFSQSRSMDMWTAALKWALESDSIVSQHYVALAAQSKSASEKKPSPELPVRSPAVASPMTPRPFSLPRTSLTIPLDDDVRRRLCAC